MARSIDKEGNLIDPVNAPWKTGGAFTTPPGWWHSHVNESDEDAWVLPVQDAGLFTHQVCLALLHYLISAILHVPIQPVARAVARYVPIARHVSFSEKSA